MSLSDAPRPCARLARPLLVQGLLCCALVGVSVTATGCSSFKEFVQERRRANVRKATPRPSIRGVYAFKRFREGGKTRQIRDLFDSGELEVVWLRWLWSFKDESVTTQLQFLIRAEKGSYYACDAILSTDVSWSGDQVTFPATVRARGVVVTIDGEFALDEGQLKYNYSKRKRNCGVRISRGRHTFRKQGDGFWLCAADRADECMIFERSTVDVDYEKKVLDHARDTLLRERAR